MNRLRLLSAACLFSCIAAAQADSYTLHSPDKRLAVQVGNAANGLSYSVSLDGNTFITPSALGLIINDLPIGQAEMKFQGKQDARIEDSFELFAGKTRHIADHYNTSTFKFTSNDERKLDLQLVVRVYDHGVALRYVLPEQPGLQSFTIQNETTRFGFAGDYACHGLNLGKFANSHEGEFDPVQASHIREHNLYDAPLVCKTGVGQTTFALAESDVRNYPGAWFTGRGDGKLGLDIRLTPRFDSRPDGLEKAAVRATMGADGVRTPWRVIMVGDSPGELVESTLIATLGEPSQVKDTNWIKPGKTAWDWWNDNQVAITNPGMNTDTYKAYIDFASKLGLEYILIDAGWHEGTSVTSKPGANLLKPVPAMDLPAILAYAKSKNVGVWLWVQWKQLDWQMEEALAAYQQWGVKGIKVDFMDRSDQEMVDYTHKLLTATGKHQLMVNLHGAYPPNGLARTYPHYLTQEAVLGAEYNKWSVRITATHNVTLPFTRMILGPMDYTPGGFRHAAPAEFPTLFRNTLPYVQTTRGQALAMYVVYDSPLQMLADSPITYTRADGSWEQGLDFIRDVPVTWDETRIVQGDIGQYIVSARRKGNDWYLGAMTNESGRSLRIPLDFLGEGQFDIQVWEDGETLSTLQQSQATSDAGQTLELALAASGGAVAVLRKK